MAAAASSAPSGSDVDMKDAGKMTEDANSDKDDNADGFDVEGAFPNSALPVR